MSNLLPDDVQLNGDEPFVLALRDIPGEITIHYGSEFAYQVESGDPDDLTEERDGNIVLLKGKRPLSGGASVNVSGNSISVSGSGSSVISANGRVIVNGVDVTDAVSSGAKSDMPPLKVSISLPMHSGLVIGAVDSLRSSTNLALGGVFLQVDGGKDKVVLASQVNGLRGSLTGRSDFNASHVEGLIALSGTGQCRIGISKANVEAASVAMTGQSEAHLRGMFGSISATATGQSEIRTNGPVKGNYTATGTGQCDIVHRGGVSGHVMKSSTGQSTVDIR